MAASSPRRPPCSVFVPEVEKSVEKGAGCQHGRRRGEKIPIGGGDAGQPAVRGAVEGGGLTLDNGEVWLRRQQRLNGIAIQLAVRLRARAAHGGTFRAVQQFKMDTGGVGRFAHQPVQRVDLPHQMALADAADGGVARHLPQPVTPVGDQQRVGAGARGCGRGLTPRMAAADDNDVVAHGASVSEVSSSARDADERLQISCRGLPTRLEPLVAPQTLFHNATVSGLFNSSRAPRSGGRKTFWFIAASIRSAAASA